MIGALVAWLYANVLGNMVASVLWATPAFMIHHRRLKAHHTAEIGKLREELGAPR